MTTPDQGLAEATQRVFAIICSSTCTMPNCNQDAERTARAAREDVAETVRAASEKAWDEGARHGLLTADWEYCARVNCPDPTNPYARAVTAASHTTPTTDPEGV